METCAWAWLFFPSSVLWYGLSGLGLTGALQAARTEPGLCPCAGWVAALPLWSGQQSATAELHPQPSASVVSHLRHHFPPPAPSSVHFPGQGWIVVKTRALEAAPQPLTPTSTPDILCEPLWVLQLSWGSALQVYNGVKIPVFSGGCN